MRNKKKIAALATGALVLGSAGVAYSYWTTTGSGSDTGTTTAGASDTLNFDHDALTPMYPGDAPQPLTVAVSNDKSAPTQSVYVTTVEAYVTTDKDGCDGTDFFLTDGSAGAVGSTSSETSPVTLTWEAQDLAVDETRDATGTIQFNNKSGENANQDACKGATVTIHYLAS